MNEFAPDLGLEWWKAGHAGKQIQLTRMPIDSIGRVSNNVFTTTVNIPMDQVFALTFDFGRSELDALLGFMPARLATTLRADLTVPFGQPAFIEIPRVLVDLTAHLGEPQENGDETYVPLVVDSFAAATAMMGFNITDR
jgi:hypothetical protein